MQRKDWTCPVCFYTNDAHLLECELCKANELITKRVDTFEDVDEADGEDRPNKGKDAGKMSVDDVLLVAINMNRCPLTGIISLLVLFSI